MEQQVKADHSKRAAILKSKGQKEYAINIIEDKKQTQVLIAAGGTDAMLAVETARAQTPEALNNKVKHKLNKRL